MDRLAVRGLQVSAVARDVYRLRLLELVVDDVLDAALALRHGAGPGGVGHLGGSLAVEVGVVAGGASAHGGGKSNRAGIPGHLSKEIEIELKIHLNQCDLFK